MSTVTTIAGFEQTIIAADADAGVAIGWLLQRHPDIARRTAQRWLNQLLTEDKIIAVGQGRNRRYIVNRAGRAVVKPAIGSVGQFGDENAKRATTVFPDYIPLSPDSRDILAYIEQPQGARKPVGYQRDFLDAYQPNVSHYLPEPIRNQLRRMGKPQTNGLIGVDCLLIDLSWASSHLEGNTYTRLDTRELIEHGKIADGKGTIETQMILNHKSAIELLVDNAELIDFNRYTLLNLHSALAENLLPNPADEGRVRQHLVEIGKSVYRPLAGEVQLGEVLDEVLFKAEQIDDPFEQSFFIMVHLPYLQPFADINKRTSRLAANLPLIRANLCPLTFLDVPEQAYSRAILGVYELTRVELLRDLYVWAYERSAQEYLAIKQNLAAPDPFRLQYRDVIKQVVRAVVIAADVAPLAVIEQQLNETALTRQIASADLDNVQALVIEELRRLHQGVLARYGLKPSEYQHWQRYQDKGSGV